MGVVKAKLKVVLQADDTVVAESEDSGLWQQVLLAINKGGDSSSALHGGAIVSPPPLRNIEPAPAAPVAGEGDNEIARFAREVGVNPEIIQGACSPSSSSPYLTLDMHCWNAMKEQTPTRGIGSISPMAVAATLLSLWMRAAKLGNATQAEAQKVLGTLSLRDANAARSIQASEWLQGRPGGVIVLNPARVKRAIAIAKAFCSQDWKSDFAWKGGNTE